MTYKKKNGDGRSIPFQMKISHAHEKKLLFFMEIGLEKHEIGLLGFKLAFEHMEQLHYLFPDKRMFKKELAFKHPEIFQITERREIEA